jgi:hypothetical protein
MACDLTLGRIEPCKDVVGGIKSVYFVNFGSITAYTQEATDEISAVTGTPSAYQYDVKSASSFTQNIQSDRATGTSSYEQVIELTLKKLTVADHKEIKLLVYGRPNVLVEDYNGNIFIAGLEHGMEVTGGTIVTGAAMNELTGYTLTLTGMERLPANFFDDTLATIGFTVVAGS